MLDVDGGVEMLREETKKGQGPSSWQVSGYGSGVGVKDAMGDENEGINWPRPARSP